MNSIATGPVPLPLVLPFLQDLLEERGGGLLEQLFASSVLVADHAVMVEEVEIDPGVPGGLNRSRLAVLARVPPEPGGEAAGLEGPLQRGAVAAVSGHSEQGERSALEPPGGLADPHGDGGRAACGTAELASRAEVE